MRSRTLLLVIVFILILMRTPVWGQTQFFQYPGSFGYALNSVNQVFDVNSAGTIGIALRNDPSNAHLPSLMTFNPSTGQVLDTKTFGFGPLEVKLVQIPEGLRAVVLTSQGGPRNVFLFNISPAGLIGSLSQTQLTASINDGGSNLVVSAAAKVGFVVVYAPPSGLGKDLVSFSLVDGAILGRVRIEPTISIKDKLSMVETPDGRRLLAFFNYLDTVAILDATKLAQPVLLGTVSLPVAQGGGITPSGVAFRSDGRYLYASNSYTDLSVVDVNAMSVVGSIGGSMRYSNVEASEGISGTQLAALSSNSTSVGISLIDAQDPAHPTVVQRYTPTGLSYKSGIQFSKDGRKLYIATNTVTVGLNVPTFQESFVVPIAGSRQAQQVLAPGLCAPERIFSAYSGISDVYLASTNVASVPAGPARARDFDGDGRSDVLWRDTAGNVSVWQMNGTRIVANTAIGNVWPGWTVAGSGDFNGDGKADVFWRDGEGNIAVWQMDAAAVCSYGVVGNIPSTAAVAGVADFDGDGRPDILWRDVSGDVGIWKTNVPTGGAANLVISNIWMGWTISGIGDFNGDGKSDILWRSVSGDVALWLMNGTTVVNSTVIANIGEGWTTSDTGDFNGDGKSDLLWRSVSGDVAVWLMNGTTVANGTAISRISTEWAIAGARDFDGNGRADILWRDSSGNVAVWLMDGTTVSSYVGIGNVTDRKAQ